MKFHFKCTCGRKLEVEQSREDRYTKEIYLIIEPCKICLIEKSKDGARNVINKIVDC